VLESFGEKVKDQRIWEGLTLPKDYQWESRLFQNPMIVFVITGSVQLEINKEETHSVFASEMFITESNNLYGITMMEQTRLLICHVPPEVWFVEQERIDELIKEEGTLSEEFFKLPVKKVILRCLLLLEQYLKEAIYPSYFFELKRQELFYLLFYNYAKQDLLRFLQCILAKDIEFKKFVMNNYFKAKNVQELAKSANYSTSGFIKKFQKCFNDSPYRWMQRQKAKHISLEINRGIKSLQEIANEYNFSSFQHFSGFCKLHLGSPPSEILSKNRIKKTIN